MDFHRTFQGGKDMNLKLENSLVVLSQRKKEQGLPQRPTKKERNQELTQEERLLQHYQEQISQMHESNFQQELQAKLDSGQELTPEEEQYLEKVNPDALKEHEKLKEEVAAYRKQLQNCRTKKDVEKLKLYKMGQFMSEVKTVSNDPHIPKAQKKALLEQILKRTYAIEKEHNDYTKTPEYQTKPDKEPYEDVSPADKDKSSADSTDATTSDSTDNAEISSGSDSANNTINATDDGSDSDSAPGAASDPASAKHTSDSIKAASGKSAEEPVTAQSVRREINIHLSGLRKKAAHIDASV